MRTILRKARKEDASAIWCMLQNAIERRRKDGSEQWQDGYPNPTVVANDIENGFGYVMILEDELVGYVSVMINNEPAYEAIDGQWLTEGNFIVFHRVAIAEKHLGKGFAKELFKHIEAFAQEQQIFSIKVDTNFDNHGMLHILKQLDYVYCGEVHFRGSARKAFEKDLNL